MTVEQMQEVVKEQQRTRMNVENLQHQVNILQQNMHWLESLNRRLLFRLQQMEEAERRIDLEAAAEAAQVEARFLNGGKGKGKGKRGKGKRKGN